MIFAKIVFFSLGLATVVSADEESTYATCDEVNSNDVNSVIKSTVDRLMELRYPSWGWSNTPEVVLGLQLSAQTQFFGRDKAIERMEREFRREFRSMNIGKLALYVLAAKSACLNATNFGGKDLLRVLDIRSRRQFRYNGSDNIVPFDRYYRFGLTLGALCVSGRPARNWVVRKTLEGQQPDGSFGGSHSVDDAAQILLALSCIQTEDRPRNLQLHVNEAVNRLVSFLKSKVENEGDDVWVGNKYSSPSSALALMKAETSEEWKCRDIMKSLAINPEPLDGEGAFSQRLPALAGVSYLALQATDWECLDTVPIPEGYEPTCNPIDPSTCNPTQPTTSSNMISVRLTIYTLPPPSDGGIPNADETVRVKNGSTLYEAMVAARNDGQITFESTTTSWGESITSIQGVEANSTARQYWALINGATKELLPKGVSGYVPTDGEQIEFRRKTW